MIDTSRVHKVRLHFAAAHYRLDAGNTRTTTEEDKSKPKHSFVFTSLVIKHDSTGLVFAAPTGSRQVS